MNLWVLIGAAVATGIVGFIAGRLNRWLDSGEARDEKTQGKIERVDSTARSEIDRVERELGLRTAALDGRLTRVEEEIRHLPNTADFRGLLDRLGVLEREVTGASTKLDGQSDMIRAIRDHVFSMERT